MLTDSQCRSAKCKDKPYKLTDTNGLYLEVKPNGVKAWRYRFKLTTAGETKESAFAIGDYASAPAGETAEEAKARRAGGRFTLAEARDERTKARALVKQGINPAHHRQFGRLKREQENATTFEAIAREWLALRDWEEVTKGRRLNMLQRVVFPKIGVLPAKQVTPAHVLDVLKTALKKNGPSVAAEAKRTMSAVFELAVSTLRAESDPVYSVRKALPANKTQHKRLLTTEEVGQLLRQLDGYDRNFQTVSVFRLMWLTLCRPNEAIGAQWKEIDLEHAVWRIPPERMKKRKEHVVPLPRQALNQLGCGGKYSPHATRTTGSTRLNEMGFSPDWIERQLARAEPNVVRRTYNHADYLADRTKMMQHWADMLDAWKAGAKVLPLRGAAA